METGRPELARLTPCQQQWLSLAVASGQQDHHVGPVPAGILQLPGFFFRTARGPLSAWFIILTGKGKVFFYLVGFIWSSW